MKPFNLQKAIEGHKLITRDKSYKNITLREVRLSEPPLYQVKSSYGDTIFYTNTEGKNFYGVDSDMDLYLQEDPDLTLEEPFKKTQVRVVYKDGSQETIHLTNVSFVEVRL